ncbi:MAG: hypothetical protein WKG01_22110 [Kofleriaceae bacterium]
MRTYLVIAALILVGCSQSKRSDAPLPAVDPTRISHERHATISCDNCHRSNKRPGADDHKPCDDPACHAKAFLERPTPFCQVCHTKIATQPQLSAPLKPYPSDDAWQAQPPTFSHRRHLDASKMEGAVGFHVQCTDCHTRDGSKVRPDHATCSRCHAAEAGLTKAPRMEDCSRCHTGGTRVRTRARVITNDLKPFDHERHRTDRKGRAIKCEDCHTRSAQSQSYADHGAPRIEGCVGCHDDSDRVPYQMRMRICETCHRERAATLTAIAPRNHLPATERPIDHTIAFRRDHAEAAARATARCAGCHTQMSGNPRQACDECHQTMTPADHRITWRELDHGPEAAASRDRCATCHVVEFCTACHAQRPRSHGFYGSFTTEHARLARINVRACATCHVESFCAECHAAPAARYR